MRSLILLLMLVAAILSPGGPSAAHDAARTAPTWSAPAEFHRTGATAVAAANCDQRCPAVLPDQGGTPSIADGAAHRYPPDRKRLAGGYEPPVPSGVPRRWRT